MSLVHQIYAKSYIVKKLAEFWGFENFMMAFWVKDFGKEFYGG